MTPSGPTRTMQPRFFYFDLGKVLLNFDIGQMLRQMSNVAGVTAESLREIIFGGGLQRRYESGEISDGEFFDTLCQQAGVRPDQQALRLAGNDIFELNQPMLSLVTQLRAAGYRLGILSNTCQSHWEHCKQRYRILTGLFDVAALSFEHRTMKPDAAMYRAAAELAGCPPQEIFFVDDIADNVEGARAAGFDAVQYLTAAQLAADLRRRGVRFNY
jgi:glucose-1-phosphatase